MKKIISLIILLFIANGMFSQITFLETESCPIIATNSSAAYGCEIFGSDADVYGNEAIVAGIGTYGLYEKCEGGWKLTYSDDDSGTNIVCAMGEDYYAVQYATPLGFPSYYVISIYSKNDPGVSLHWIELPSFVFGDVMWFAGNNLYVKGLNHSLSVYREVNDWTEESIFDYSSDGIVYDIYSYTDNQVLVLVSDNVNDERYLKVYTKFGGVWDTGVVLGDVEYNTDTYMYPYYSTSFIYKYFVEYNSVSLEYEAVIDVYENESGDWVYLNTIDFEYPGIIIGVADDYIITAESSYGNMVVKRNDVGDWSTISEEYISTDSWTNTSDYILGVWVEEQDIIIGEANYGTTISYSGGSYSPGAVHFYEDMDQTPMELLIYADGTSSNATSWQILDASSSVVASGPSVAYAGSCALRTESFNLPPGSYGLRVVDADNTVCSGGFLLRTAAGEVVLDATSVPAFTSPSQFTTTENFQIPVGPIAVTNSPLPASSNTYLIASEDCELQGLCDGVGSLDNATTAYQWEYFKPHGTSPSPAYARLVAYHWNGSFTGFPGATVCEKRRASRPAGLVSSPIPLNQYLNVRIRAKVNGEYRSWGPVKTVYYTTSLRPANWRVSPNPVATDNGQLRLEVVTQDEMGIPILYDAELRMTSLRLLDLSGRVLASRGGLEYSIEEPYFWDISDVKLSTGMYLVEVTTNTGLSATKIMVQ